MKKTITVKIRPDGTVQTETHGIKGESCLNYLHKVEEISGTVAVSRELKDEYHQTESVFRQTTTEVETKLGLDE